jgi:ABC-type nitrate/sulfonate/bicarbonate transport system ATPase subunit
MKPKTVVEGVGFHYSGHRYSLEDLREINFTCHEREIVAIGGPCGCGKSTLTNIIAGLKKTK